MNQSNLYTKGKLLKNELSRRPTSKAVKFNSIPQELQSLDRWLVWRYELRNGKHAKIPYQPSGTPARVNDPETWSEYVDAQKAYEEGEYDGVGLVLPDDVVGIDLDDVINEGEMSESAKLIVSRLNTYTEISPSGTGVKALVFGNASPRLTKVDHARGIEIYDGGETNRYFAITGDHLDGTPTTVNGSRDGVYAVQTIISEPLDDRFFDADRSVDPQDRAKAIGLLGHLSQRRCEAYHDWLQVGMALHSVDSSDAMLAIWDEWSKAGSTYRGYEDCEYKVLSQNWYLSFLRHRRCLAGTMFSCQGGHVDGSLVTDG